MLKKQNRLWTEKQRHHLRRVAWVNIFAQVAFPVAAAFTPAVAMAPNEHQAQKAHSHIEQTRPYRLNAGESVKTVAKRHGLTVMELKKLNQQRVFNKPFTALGAGDEIDVPHFESDSVLPNKLLADNSLADKLKPESAAPLTENATEHWLARAASQAAGMLKGGNIVDSTRNQLRSMAVGEANQAVRNWLQRYGNVKIQANVDDRGRLDGSQFDMLLPLYDTAKHLTFTQFGLRHIDSRTTANVGLGQRHFFDDGMFGYNAFLDHDITRDHTRFGIGAEYARDFMKFAANGYFRASGWKDGKKLADYEERPANGFDLRAEGYVPTYPQLGGKLTYEQYFGNEVGLLSERQRQKNPAAFTLGVNYTPIPLVTLGLDRRQSASGGGDTLFNLGLNYEIGTPWSKQIDPDAVAFKRTLQGGRYDLVDRNNQIVLEYRKKILIRMMMEPRIIGRGGAIIPLNVTVSTKHGLKDIIWDTANLTAGGGKLEAAGNPADSLAAETVRGGTHYLLTLPPYNAEGNNTYNLSGVAYDLQGNASERMEAQILVTASAVNPANSGFEPANKSMVADGKTQTVIRLKLTDKNGKPVSGAAGSISLTDDKSKLTGDGKDPLLGTEIKEVPEGSGIYEVTATAGTKHGKWTIKPTVDGHELPSTVIDFGDSLGNMIDTEQTKFEPDNGTLNKENEETDIVLKLIDKEGKPITGAVDKIKLTEDRSELYGEEPYPHVTGIKEDPAGSGIYKAKVVAGKKKGTLKVTPVVDGKELKPTRVTFGESLAEIVDTKGSVFTPATNVLAADNEDSTTMTLELKDKQGKAIKHAKDSITFDDQGSQLTGDGKNPPTIDKDNIWEDPEGTYHVKVKAGGKTGKWEITTKIDGKPLDNKTIINFDANKGDLVDPNKSTFVAKESELPNDGDTTVIEVDLRDKDNKPITGAENSINMIPNNSGLYGSGHKMPTVDKFKEVPVGSGHYQATVTAGDKKGKWELAPEVFGKRVETKPTTVTFGKSLADKLNPKSPEVDPADGSKALPADGHTTKTLRITLKDGDDKPIYGAKDSIIVTGDNATLKGEGEDPIIEDVKEIGDGVYEVVITAGTKTGHWAVTTTVDGKKNPQPFELEFDTLNAPTISGLTVSGKMALGKTLSAKYDFEANGGNEDDHSFFAWGAENTTADKVKALAKAADLKEGKLSRLAVTQEGLMQFGNVSEKGNVPDYTITPDAQGRILEVSVLAANMVNIGSSTPHTIILRKGEKGNQTTGGNSQGGVPDPNANPSIDNIVLSGDLKIGETLKAEYSFNDNDGDPFDKSLFAWHEKDSTPQTFQMVQDESGVLDKKLIKEDAGKTWAITIKPVNSQNGTGEPKTVNTGMTEQEGNTTKSKGALPGTVLDPDAIPSIDNVVLSGLRYVGETIKAKYVFNSNGGYAEDKSTYAWRRLDKIGGTPVEVNEPGATGTVDGKGGSIESYKIPESDKNTYLVLVLTPYNGHKSGVEVTKNTSQEEKGNDLQGGGSSGDIIDPSKGPDIENLEIQGQLTYNGKLTAKYHFNDKGGHNKDVSLYLWGIKYPAEDPRSTQNPENQVNKFSGQDKDHVVPGDGTVPEFSLKPEHSGHVIQLAIQSRSPLRRGESRNKDTAEYTGAGSLGGNKDGTVQGSADTVTVGVDNDKAMAKKDLLGTKLEPGDKPESIELTIKTLKDNAAIGGVPVTITMTAKRRWKSVSETPTAKLEVEDEKGVLYETDGTLNGNVRTYTGHTDEKGELIIKITDPNGKGVKTTLEVTAKGATEKKSQDVTFTVVTSPDVDEANYYGHMHEYIEFDGKKFYRTPLHNEYAGTKDENGNVDGEDWSYFHPDAAPNACIHNGRILASKDELIGLYNKYSDKKMREEHGWPYRYEYYSSSFTNGGHRLLVSFENGKTAEGNSATNRFVGCRDK
ncbi:inverse autotransporter beta domain-containing protein [Xenorhabdus sp. M]|uniref:Inverse autotransporter beta domain-containing protein n=1 Tax=Xenorhabdus szentirmaii TaxID=290112 RepID=A0AAW3YXW0_9GAMM|nr:inverse autotransporter beta domain-containing protein [Xenorhabdus sp. M]MBD2801602.1 inverse autotransporter beta domain-containing protein [Xenorhabdus sp. M]